MIIPVTLSTGDSNLKLPHGLAKISNDEVVLIELQGALDVEAKHPSERNGKLVGKLTIDEAMSKPLLRIGHHLLEGKIATINKPLAVMHRPHDGGSMDVDEDTQGDGPGIKSSGSQRLGWTILGVVRKKIIFSKRPMPITKG
ncbi:hypothetical protein FA15DRAFT_89262 [Coprinopsis marcescibilis]|uniref:Ctf8-domain-containing protein n=1 Tax=Coprinopsis marcescibilis TaxID=230819 RepID=A0A5C3L610_COPMA|nr:hypothetical protein FA15DRAFT_89262 [Coprinopsis marcescibilis]